MVVGLVAGVAIGAAGTWVITRIHDGNAGGDESKAREHGGSGAAEAAALLMPGATSMSALNLKVSLESSSSLLSALIQQLWPQLNKIGIKIVKDSVEPMFEAMLPSPFKKMHFRTLDLGNAPLKVENFVVHPVVDDTMRIELEINWDSTCNILLAGLPGGSTIGVQKIKLRSRLVIVCRPILDVVPVISSAQVAFINQPFIDLDFTGLANVADWGNVRPMVDKGIRDGLSGSLVLPQQMFVKVDPSCDFIKAYQRPLGVLRVKLVKGRDFPILKSRIVTDVPDLYCTLQLGNKEWTSSVIKDRTDPEWNQTFDFVLSDYGQILEVHTWDKDRLLSDKYMGAIQISAVDLLKHGGKKEFTLSCPPSGDKKKQYKAPSAGKVTLECELVPFCKDISSITAENQQSAPNTIKGMVIVFVSKLENLPVPREEAESYVKVTIGETTVQTSTVKYDVEAAAAAEEAANASAGEPSKPADSVLNPEYNAAFQIPIFTSDPATEKITFELINGKKSLGRMDITKDAFMVMRDEYSHANTIIGGATLHCGVQAMGLNTVNGTVAPLSIGDDQNV